MITQFLRLSGYAPGDVDDVIITSVVPKVMHSFRASIVKFLNIDPMIVGPGVKTGINIRMDNPRNMGADCIADCRGATTSMAGPNCWWADFGDGHHIQLCDRRCVGDLRAHHHRHSHRRGRLVGCHGPVAGSGNHAPLVDSGEKHQPAMQPACITTSLAASNVRSRNSIVKSTRISA